MGILCFFGSLSFWVLFCFWCLLCFFGGFVWVLHETHPNKAIKKHYAQKPYFQCFGTFFSGEGFGKRNAKQRPTKPFRKCFLVYFLFVYISSFASLLFIFFPVSPSLHCLLKRAKLMLKAKRRQKKEKRQKRRTRK